MQQSRLFVYVGCLVLLASSTVQAQEFDPDYYYRITSGWQTDKSLDVINDGDKNNQVHLAKTENLTGQMWRITNLGDGYYRFTNGWQKDKSLDVVNDGDKNNQLHLANTKNVTGQMWSIKDLSDGYYGLTCVFRGSGSSLDVINDGDKNSQLHLANTANLTGQMWKFEKTNVKVERQKPRGRNTCSARRRPFATGYGDLVITNGAR